MKTNLYEVRIQREGRFYAKLKFLLENEGRKFRHLRKFVAFKAWILKCFKKITLKSLPKFREKLEFKPLKKCNNGILKILNLFKGLNKRGFKRQKLLKSLWNRGLNFWGKGGIFCGNLRVRFGIFFGIFKVRFFLN